LPHNGGMSLLVATWTGAIATAVLAIGAGFTVYYARNAFQAQSEEVRLLQRQVNAQQADAERFALQLERQQADAVGVRWRPGHSVKNSASPDLTYSGRVMIVENKSERPIRDVTCRVLLADGTAVEPAGHGLYWADGLRDRPGPLMDPGGGVSIAVLRPNWDCG
jgi:hypothetical protein